MKQLANHTKQDIFRRRQSFATTEPHFPKILKMHQFWRTAAILMSLIQSARAADNASLSDDVQNGTIKIGYLLAESSPPYRAGAINLAIEQAKSDGLLPGFNFR